ncbi:hypothetical protein [Listeria booriae]|uniref:hypothetical protein n=1 Tax=Listeria booriae TaxID=1552123 RepID=UPI00163DC47D|nr:hypothetical protein [Listeria booriae]MBC1306948.1 hypothetical protein [Listeria booriae]
MTKKKKRKQKPSTVTPSTRHSADTNQENIVRPLKQQSSKKSKLVWAIPVVISLVSLVASIWIFFDTKKTTEIMNEMSIKNAPIDYKLNKVEIEKEDDKSTIMLSDDSIGSFSTYMNLRIESQNQQGQIKRAYLIQKNNLDEKVGKENFLYLGKSESLEKRVNVVSPGNKILRVLSLYLLIEDYNGNVSIDYIQIHYAPTKMAMILTSKSVQMDDGRYIGDVAVFPYFFPYTEYKQIDYSTLMDSSYFQKTNRKLEKSFKTYKDKVKHQYELLTNESKSTYSKGMEYFLNEKIDSISQNNVLTDVKKIKEIYDSIYK